MTADPHDASHNEGVQISGGTQYGPLAGGYQAQAIVHNTPPAALPAPQTALLQAIAGLRAELVALLASEPGAIAQDAAEDAEQALAETESEAERAEPRPGMLRRRIQTVADALGGVAATAGGISALQEAYRALFPSG
ncbi:hypothetical protein JGB26_37175 [Streptomyces flavofungini]|uniref:Uncharacterized protein n=1 Tax=Streptomyces flavofungini TaxID=68200 RepID=A0ABS0XHG3_9ACTN|nr:hypothetical protein [Streptomyces flavofungini]MBJ3812642.1 hypothetical protein [Streptomyces flavofungini]